MSSAARSAGTRPRPQTRPRGTGVFGAPALLKNGLIRRYLSAYAEQDWDHVVKVLVLLGILTAQQAAQRVAGGVRALTMQELEDLVAQGARGAALATDLPALVSSARGLAQRVDVAVKEALGEEGAGSPWSEPEEEKRDEGAKKQAGPSREPALLQDDLVTTRYLKVKSSGYGQPKGASRQQRGTSSRRSSTSASGSGARGAASAAARPPPPPSVGSLETGADAGGGSDAAEVREGAPSRLGHEAAAPRIAEREPSRVEAAESHGKPPAVEAAEAAARNAERQRGELWLAYRGQAPAEASVGVSAKAIAAGASEEGKRAQSAERAGVDQVRQSTERAGVEQVRQSTERLGLRESSAAEEESWTVAAAARRRARPTRRDTRLAATQLIKGEPLPPYLRPVASRIRPLLRADRAARPREPGERVAEREDAAAHGGEEEEEEGEERGARDVDAAEGRARLARARELRRKLDKGIVPADRSLPQYETETRGRAAPAHGRRAPGVAWVVPPPGDAQYSHRRRIPPPTLGTNPRFFRPSDLPPGPPEEEAVEADEAEDHEDGAEDHDDHDEARWRAEARSEAASKAQAEEEAERVLQARLLARAPLPSAPPPPVASWEQLAPTLQAWLAEEEMRQRRSDALRSQAAPAASLPAPRRRSVLELASSLLGPSAAVTAAPPLQSQQGQRVELSETAQQQGRRVELSETERDLAYAAAPERRSSSDPRRPGRDWATGRASHYAEYTADTADESRAGSVRVGVTRRVVHAVPMLVAQRAADGGAALAPSQSRSAERAAVPPAGPSEQRAPTADAPPRPMRFTPLETGSVGDAGAGAGAAPVPPQSPLGRVRSSPVRSVPVNDVDLDDVPASPRGGVAAPAAARDGGGAAPASASSPLTRIPSDYVAAMLASAYARAAVTTSDASASDARHDRRQQHDDEDEEEEEGEGEETFEGVEGPDKVLDGGGRAEDGALASALASALRAETRASVAAVAGGDLAPADARGVADEAAAGAAPLSPTRRAWAEREEEVQEEGEGGKRRGAEAAGGVELGEVDDEEKGVEIEPEAPAESPSAPSAPQVPPPLPESPADEDQGGDDDDDDDDDDGWGAAVASTRGGRAQGAAAAATRAVALAVAASEPRRTDLLRAHETETLQANLNQLVSLLDQLEQADSAAGGSPGASEQDDGNNTGPDQFFDARGSSDDDDRDSSVGDGDGDGDAHGQTLARRGHDDDDDDDDDDGDLEERVRRLRATLQARGQSNFLSEVMATISGLDDDDDDGGDDEGAF